MIVLLVVVVTALGFAGGVITERLNSRRDLARLIEEERIAEPLPEPMPERPTQVYAQPRPPSAGYAPRHADNRGVMTTEFERIIERSYAGTEDAT